MLVARSNSFARESDPSLPFGSCPAHSRSSRMRARGGFAIVRRRHSSSTKKSPPYSTYSRTDLRWWVARQSSRPVSAACTSGAFDTTCTSRSRPAESWWRSSRCGMAAEARPPRFERGIASEPPASHTSWPRVASSTACSRARARSSRPAVQLQQHLEGQIPQLVTLATPRPRQTVGMTHANRLRLDRSPRFSFTHRFEPTTTHLDQRVFFRVRLPAPPLLNPRRLKPTGVSCLGISWWRCWWRWPLSPR